MMLTAMVLAAAVAADAPAGSSTSSGTPPAGAAAPAGDAAAATADPDKLICKSEVITGTHMMGRVCKTQAQWDQSEEQGQRWLNGIRNGATTPGEVQAGGGPP